MSTENYETPPIYIVRKHPGAEVFVIETVGKDDLPREVDPKKEYDAFDKIEDAVDAAAAAGGTEVWVHADCHGPASWRQYCQQFIGDDWGDLPF